MAENVLQNALQQVFQNRYFDLETRLFTLIREVHIPPGQRASFDADATNVHNSVLETLSGVHQETRSIPIEVYKECLQNLRTIALTSKSSIEQYGRVRLPKHAETISTITENSASVHRTVHQLAAVATMGVIYYAMTQGNTGAVIPLAASAWLYWQDAQQNKGKDLFAREGLVGTLFGLFPAIPAALNYYHNNESSAASFDLFMYSVIPSHVFTIGHLIPWTVRVKYGSIKRHIDRFRELRNIPNDIRKDMERFEYALREVTHVQKLQVSDNPAYWVMAQTFETLCRDYLSGTATKEDMMRARKNLYHFVQQQTVSEGDQASQREAQVRTSGNSPSVYTLAITYGLDDAVARRLDKRVSHETARDTMVRLEAMFQDSYAAILRANPDLLLLSGQERKVYFGAVNRLQEDLQTYFRQNIPAEYTPVTNPVAFSSTQGIEGLRQRLRDHAFHDVRETAR